VKKNPNDELRFLMKNPTRSDFFIAIVTIAFIYMWLLLAVYWRARRRLLREKRNRWDPAGAEGTMRLSARSRKAKSCREINSGVSSSSAPLSNLFVFRLHWFCYVAISSFMKKRLPVHSVASDG